MASDESDTTQPAATDGAWVSRADLDAIRECIIDLYEHMPAGNGGYERVVEAVRLCNRLDATLQYHRPRSYRLVHGKSEVSP